MGIVLAMFLYNAFVFLSVLHDLPVLLFAAPGIADWWAGWHHKNSRRRLTARAARLGKSSWVEITFDAWDDRGELLKSLSLTHTHTNFWWALSHFVHSKRPIYLQRPRALDQPGSQ